MDRLLIIPAAGLGSRLGASKPKPLVEVNGRAMLDHLGDRYAPFVARIVVIAHPAAGRLDHVGRSDHRAAGHARAPGPGHIADAAARARAADGEAPGSVYALRTRHGRTPAPFPAAAGRGPDARGRGERHGGVCDDPRDVRTRSAGLRPRGPARIGDRRTQLRPLRCLARATQAGGNVPVHRSDGGDRRQHTGGTAAGGELAPRSRMKILSVVIPAYNEERFIGTLLEKIKAVDLAPLG